MVLPTGCTMCVGSGIMCRVKRNTNLIYKLEGVVVPKI